MTQTTTHTRRRFLRKITGGTVAGGVLLGTTATPAQAASRRYITFTETRGSRAYYTLNVNSKGSTKLNPHLRGEGGSLEDDDAVVDPDKGIAKGYINGGSDTYSFYGQLEWVEVQDNHDRSPRVEVNCRAGDTHSEKSGVEVSSANNGSNSARCSFFVTQGDSVTAPGDGTLESNDQVNAGSGVSYTKEGEDHFNMTGLIDFMVMEPNGAGAHKFVKYINTPW